MKQGAKTYFITHSRSSCDKTFKRSSKLSMTVILATFLLPDVGSVISCSSSLTGLSSSVRDAEEPATNNDVLECVAVATANRFHCFFGRHRHGAGLSQLARYLGFRGLPPQATLAGVFIGGGFDRRIRRRAPHADPY